jgi:hypothetical protein
LVTAAADLADDERAAQFCEYLGMNGYVVEDCQWMSILPGVASSFVTVTLLPRLV